MIALALALLTAAPSPLACPAGTEYRGARPPEGYEEWCVAPEGDGGKERREGPSIEYWDDGGVRIESRYHAGVLDGPFVERHRGGRVARQGAYAAGLRTGIWRFHDAAGGLEEESSWRDGALHGPYASFWPDGKPKSQGRNCLGAQCGTWRTYDQAGRLQGTVEFGERRAEP